jgi:hypothetical protein
MSYPYSPYVVFLGENDDGSWTAEIGYSIFKGTKAECLRWLESESPENYAADDREAATSLKPQTDAPD